MICVPYYSGAGRTRALAEAIGEGTRAHRLIDVTAMTPADWDALDAAPAIIFGAPTYMGSSAAAFGEFLEAAASRWDTGGWVDKIGAGFTVAVHPSGDKLAALQRFSIFAAQMGMIWVGQPEIGAPVNPARPGINRDGSWLGLMATDTDAPDGGISTGDRETAIAFGARIATAVARWG